MKLIANILAFYQLSFNNKLESICIFCGVLALLVWPLSGTIALRNIALIAGAAISLIWFFKNQPTCRPVFLITLILMAAVPVWMLLHLLILPTDVAAQRYDLHGTWLRVSLGIILGYCFGIIIGRRPKLIFLYWATQCIFVIAILINYLYQVFIYKSIIIINFKGFFKYKSALVYFLMWPCLLSYALINAFICKDYRSKYDIKLIWFACTLCVLCWMQFVLSQTLNGLLMSGFAAITLFLIIYFFNIKKSENNYKYLLLLIILGIFILGFFSFSAIDRKHSHKLENLIEDIRLSSNINQHNAWKIDSKIQEPVYPIDEGGRLVAGSAYLRTSWFIKGLQLLYENPLGAGFSHLAFRHFVTKEDSDLDLYKTHSGWLDYALGVGVPGLLLTWGAIGLLVATSYKILSQATPGRKVILIAIIWQLLGIWLVWWPTEVSEREFIEQFFFSIAIFTGIVSQFSQYKR